jgi:hypothetical protein
MDLIELSIDEARRLKYEVGRQEHRAKRGGDEFVGDPLKELFDELLDAMNYVDECERRGLLLSSMGSHLRGLAERVQAIHVTAHEG